MPYLLQEAPEVRMALPLPPRAPDPLAAYWAEYEDLCRQISSPHQHDDDENHYEGKDELVLL